jgi:mannosyl-oligosaccharide alpha-1,3-glucosidase
LEWEESHLLEVTFDFDFKREEYKLKFETIFILADVGGFFGNPDTDLLIRWYQAGAFQPFFRAHAHIDTKRREPWLFGEPATSLIRTAVQQRYKIMPYLYTLFWESSQNGKPIMR